METASADDFHTLNYQPSHQVEFLTLVGLSTHMTTVSLGSVRLWLRTISARWAVSEYIAREAAFKRATRLDDAGLP